MSENASERDALVDEFRSGSAMPSNERHFTSSILRLTGCERACCFWKPAKHSESQQRCRATLVALLQSLSLVSSSATVQEKVGKEEITSSTPSMQQYQLSLRWTAYQEPVVVLPSGRHVATSKQQAWSLAAFSMLLIACRVPVTTHRH